MKREEIEYRIQRIEKFILQNKYTADEFYEMEAYLKEIQPTWEGCPTCPGKVQFGKILLQQKLEGLKQQLNSIEEELLPSRINEPEMEIQAEPAIELPPVPQGKVEVVSTCKRCKKKNKTGM